MPRTRASAKKTERILETRAEDVGEHGDNHFSSDTRGGVHATPRRRLELIDESEELSKDSRMSELGHFSPPKSSGRTRTRGRSTMEFEELERLIEMQSESEDELGRGGCRGGPPRRNFGNDQEPNKENEKNRGVGTFGDGRPVDTFGGGIGGGGGGGRTLGGGYRGDRNFGGEREFRGGEGGGFRGGGRVGGGSGAGRTFGRGGGGAGRNIERHIGSDVSGVKSIDKRQGRGRGNSGTQEDKLDGKADLNLTGASATMTAGGGGDKSSRTRTYSLESIPEEPVTPKGIEKGGSGNFKITDSTKPATEKVARSVMVRLKDIGKVQSKSAAVSIASKAKAKNMPNFSAMQLATPKRQTRQMSRDLGATGGVFLPKRLVVPSTIKFGPHSPNSFQFGNSNKKATEKPQIKPSEGAKDKSRQPVTPVGIQKANLRLRQAKPGPKSQPTATGNATPKNTQGTVPTSVKTNAKPAVSKPKTDQSLLCSKWDEKEGRYTGTLPKFVDTTKMSNSDVEKYLEERVRQKREWSKRIAAKKLADQQRIQQRREQFVMDRGDLRLDVNDRRKKGREELIAENRKD